MFLVALLSFLLSVIVISKLISKDIELIEEKEEIVQTTESKDEFEVVEPEVVEPEVYVVIEEAVEELVEEVILEEDAFELLFTSSEINEELFQRIDGKSLKENDDITVDDLRYLTVTHWGFDDNRYYGELIVNKAIADEVLEIFKELYEAEYPIYKMVLVDEYDADDEISMIENNTHVFNYRKVKGSNAISNHSYGLAIDINTIQNPYVKGSIIAPEAGSDYLDRNDVRKGMIIKGDVCYNAFVSRGWIWGGSWNSLKDYQHFEKKIKGINKN